MYESKHENTCLKASKTYPLYNMKKNTMAKHSFHQPDRVIKVAFRLFEVIAKHRQAVFLIQEICFITGAFLRQLIYRRIRIDCIAALCSPRTCGFELLHPYHGQPRGMSSTENTLRLRYVSVK